MNRIFPYLLALLIAGLTLLAFGEEAVLLRYRLAPGDVQVYNANARLDMKVRATQDGQSQDATTTMVIRMPFSIRGTGVSDNDGTMAAEVAIHGFDMNMDVTAAGQRMTMKADEHGLEVKQNGTTMMSGEWGSGQLSEIPDLGQLFKLKIDARFNDRGEMIEMGGLDKLGSQFQGFDLSQTLDNQIVYPEKPVKVGDSWTHEVTQEVANAALPGGTMTLDAAVTYTVLERATHRSRDCLKLRVEADFGSPDSSSGLHLDQTVTGTAYVDIATGVPLDCHLRLTQRMQGAVEGASMSLTGGGTIDLSYVGGKKKYGELIGESNDAVRDDAAREVLGTLSVPMVTEKKITINGERYGKGDTLNIDGDQYRVIAFRSTALKLHRLSDSAVYQLGLGSEGRILSVRLLGHAR